MPCGDVDVASFNEFRLCWTFQSNLRSIDVEVTLQSSLRGFERLINEGVELDVFQICARLAADEVEILAVTLAAIA